MALQTIRIGSMEDIHQYQDAGAGSFDSAIETEAPIKAGAPVDVNDVVRLDDIPALADLTTLIDNSMADALHRHSELSASDGAPDACVQVNATGEVALSRSISSATLTTAVAGPTDNLDVAGVNTVFLNCAANDVTIGGFINGVNGQVLYIARLCAGAFTATLEHAHAHAFQKIYLHAGADEGLLSEYGGWTLVCNGTHWFDLSHSKH